MPMPYIHTVVKPHVPCGATKANDDDDDHDDDDYHHHYQ